MFDREDFMDFSGNNTGTADSEMMKKLRFVIAHYKANFETVNKQEHYKWEAIAWYKKHWNIEAPDFAKMLATSFSKAANMLTSGMYYPYKMITDYANADPEAVRGIFRILYDEQLSFEERYQIFKDSCQNWITQLAQTLPNNKALNHYQDPRALMVYLTFQYPETYYFFKSTMYTTFRDRVGFIESPSQGKSVMQKIANYLQMCNIILAEVQKDTELIAMHKARLDDTCYQDEALHILTMDIVFYGSNYMSEDLFVIGDDYRPTPEELTSPETGTKEDTMDSVTDIALNTILYGPPGTGKTYHTVIFAVAIIENKKLEAVKAEAYQDVLHRYNMYKAQGLIEFTTFHQSYGYEEFIEGIRPTVADEEDGVGSSNIQYSVQPGMFKKFCEKADRSLAGRAEAAAFAISENATVWKVSLWGTGDNEVRTECLENGHIRIGWDQYGKDITDETDFSKDGGRVVLNAFINKMQIGDIVFSCYSASTIDAIGVVTGEYEWHNEFNELKRLRKVNWIVKGIRENILALNGGTAMTLASVYRLSGIAISDVYKLIEKYTPAQAVAPIKKSNYVFIIDEINRGNISKIFGELITLIEESKRVGKTEGMQTLLPYSMKPFGIPENVYIIGTMNTADRSIATIDTALRRRFAFKEMLPDPEVVAQISVENLSVKELLTRINRRITVLYDREHTIGHAYFMPLAKDNSLEKLAEIFKNKVIPLLQEYFYEDYEKIRLVLADNQKKDERDQFILAKKINQGELFGSADIGLDDGFTYEINETAFMNPEAYRQI